MSRTKWFLLLITLVGITLPISSAGVCATPRGKDQKGFILGLYAAFPQSRYDKMAERFPAFLKFCGYNTMELLDGSFGEPDNKLDSYYSTAKSDVAKAHHHGLKVYTILLTNESRRLNLKKRSQNEYKVLFNPVQEPAEYQERLTDVQNAIEKAYFASDGFEVFAGDPGGCVGQGCDLDQFLRFGKAYANMVRKLGTGAEVTLNAWAIGNWGGSLGVALNFWIADMNLAKQLIQRNVPFASAIDLDAHNFYRFLVFQLYTKASRAVPNWPDRAAIESIHAQGKRAYLWPYFIVDDDSSRPLTYNQVHFEVRYMKQLVQKVHNLGVDGVFVNVCNPEPQMGNIYAYAQLTRHPGESVQSVLKDWASLVAQPMSVQGLTDVFIFMENHSWWGSQMPPRYRLDALPCRIKNYDQALAELKNVRPLTTSSAPLLITPEAYLARVKSTLVFVKEHYKN